MGDAIELDDVRTWPECLQQRFAEPSSELAPLTDELLVELLEGRPLRMYHATRLLPHEVDRIKAEGLLRLTHELVQSKLDDAVRVGAMTEAQAVEARAGSIIETKYEGRREGQVCFVLSLDKFEHSPGDVGPLLSSWGGESIYHVAALDPPRRALMRSLGLPSIVAADVPLSTPLPYTSPSLSSVIAWHARPRETLGNETPRSSADVFLTADVPAANIATIWQAGSPEYDRFEGLPSGN
ncbi:hypothetical protein GCM10009847_25670 [Leucobacter tardus]|uniref:Uncharacterized protein n=1 Tax=Leucobacter tardus TaxID=501483 RepID=A0A939TUN8_9MICO|nr:hypothetical protein [Leucobacter tardus]MBO2989925.1 hypothetical protein [Leucobacter tardus]